MDPVPIGRDAEITEIHAFLAGVSGTPAALAITGDTGIGKTAVWRHVVQAAHRSSTVLACRPAPAERPLAFSALDDLFGDVIGEALPALPWPRKRAVEAALLREASPRVARTGLAGADRPQPDRRVLARGILDALRILSRCAPLTVAVDDAQWLDRPSAAVLEFCFRRLVSEPVSILLTFRGADAAFPLGLDRALPPYHLRHIELGPLSLDAIGEILRSQLRAAFPRHALTRLYDASAGNPFYAIESARALLDHPPAFLANEPLPIPQSLSDLVRCRLRGLTARARRVGQLVAASSHPRERMIRAACDAEESWAAIDQAIDEGIIERDGDVLRFTHPLLRAALYSEMTATQRRDVHRRLGAAADNIEERAWHVASGADRPGEQIAQLLDAAASQAALRGAPEAAGALTEQAERLTPADRSAQARARLVRAADYHFRAGDMARSRALIQSALAACTTGPARAPLLLRLATIHYHDHGWPLAERTFREAIAEAPDDAALRAHAEQELAFARLVAGDLPDASRWATASLRSAERAADKRLIAHSLARVALFDFLRGAGVRQDLLDRAEALDSAAGEEPVGRLPMLDPAVVAGVVLKWCDRLDEARLKLAARYRAALDRGDEASLPFLLYHFSQLECWAGNWDAAEEYALEACRVADENHQPPMRPATLYSLALVRAHRGRVHDSRELASEALSLCESTGNIPVSSLLAAVLGFVALSIGDYQATHLHLGRLADRTAAVGLGEPSVVKFLPDEIEALAALGQAALARSLTVQLETQGRSLGRPWALAAGARCRAHLLALDGDLEGALMACAQALSHHERLPMPFELGRTLLIKGMVERRARNRLAARESLGRALAIFEQLGAPLWAEKARGEGAKIVMRPAAGILTGTEHRIAALIAEGRTNREVASTMFVTVNTVQTHVRHIFQKLGVRSRTELAAHLLSSSVGPGAGAGAVSRASAP